MEILLHLCYTDGEIVDKRFKTVKDCMDYIYAEIIEKNEFADLILITTD